METIDDWTILLAGQAGIVTRPQLLARGITDDTVRAHVAAGRWVPVLTGIHATFTGPLSPAARQWAAVLACWPGALSHDTAAEVLGLRPAGSGDGRLHVTRPFGRSTFRTDGLDGLAVHRSRAFAHLVRPGDGVPVVSLAHTAVDLAVAEPTATAGMRSMLRSLVTSSLTTDQVRAAIELRRPRRWKQALLDALSYAEGGVTSVLEAQWTVDVEAAHRLPPPRRQVAVDVDRRRRLEDLLYRHGDREVVVRLDGRRFHAVESVNQLDRRRANAAELAGRRHLVYGWPEVTERPCVAAREVAAVLGCGFAACVRCSGL